VAGFDHHCHCIGTCIGERNHCRFYWFVFFQTIALWSAIRIVRTGYRPEQDLTDWVLRNLLPLSTSLVLWGFQIFAVIILAIHCEQDSFIDTQRRMRLTMVVVVVFDLEIKQRGWPSPTPPAMRVGKGQGACGT